MFGVDKLDRILFSCGGIKSVPKETIEVFDEPFSERQIKKWSEKDREFRVLKEIGQDSLLALDFFFFMLKRHTSGRLNYVDS